MIAAAAQWVAINCNHRWSSIWNGRPINSSNEGTNGVAVVVALFFYTLVVDVALLYAFQLTSFPLLRAQFQQHGERKNDEHLVVRGRLEFKSRRLGHGQLPF